MPKWSPGLIRPLEPEPPPSLVERLRKLVAPEIISFGVPVVGVGTGVGLLTHSWEFGGLACAVVLARLLFPDQGSNGGGRGGGGDGDGDGGDG